MNSTCRLEIHCDCQPKSLIRYPNMYGKSEFANRELPNALAWFVDCEKYGRFGSGLGSVSFVDVTLPPQSKHHRGWVSRGGWRREGRNLAPGISGKMRPPRRGVSTSVCDVKRENPGTRKQSWNWACIFKRNLSSCGLEKVYFSVISLARRILIMSTFWRNFWEKKI